jgi:hypothetical protein
MRIMLFGLCFLPFVVGCSSGPSPERSDTERSLEQSAADSDYVLVGKIDPPDPARAGAHYIAVHRWIKGPELQDFSVWSASPMDHDTDYILCLKRGKPHESLEVLAPTPLPATPENVTRLEQALRKAGR